MKSVFFCSDSWELRSGKTWTRDEISEADSEENSKENSEQNSNHYGGNKGRKKSKGKWWGKTVREIGRRKVRETVRKMVLTEGGTFPPPGPGRTVPSLSSTLTVSRIGRPRQGATPTTPPGRAGRRGRPRHDLDGHWPLLQCHDLKVREFSKAGTKTKLLKTSNGRISRIV